MAVRTSLHRHGTIHPNTPSSARPIPIGRSVGASAAARRLGEDSVGGRSDVARFCTHRRGHAAVDGRAAARRRLVDGRLAGHRRPTGARRLSAGLTTVRRTGRPGAPLSVDTLTAVSPPSNGSGSPDRPPVIGTSRADRAFEHFFRSTYEPTLRWLAQRTEYDRAYDAVQEAYIKAYERWWRVRIHPNRTAWVRRVALHESRRTWRRDARREQAEETDASHAAPDVDDIGLLDTTVTLDDMLGGLPEQQRRAMLLAHVYQMTSTEGAEIMKISPGTFRYHLHEARRALRTSATR